MRRFWYGDRPEDEQILIEGDLFHHIFSVCRFPVGGHFELLTADRSALFVEVTSIQKKSAEVVVKESRTLPEIPKPWLHLCVSLPKFATFETILEKSVELGVHTIHPFVSDYSFVKSSRKVSESKKQRWQKVIVGATQQSGRGELMTVAPIQTLQENLEEFNRKTKVQGLFLYEGQSALSLKSALSAEPYDSIEEIWAFIGSEGGFSEQEVDAFGRQRLDPVTLGSQILRVETACLALASVIKYEFGREM